MAEEEIDAMVDNEREWLAQGAAEIEKVKALLTKYADLGLSITVLGHLARLSGAYHWIIQEDLLKPTEDGVVIRWPDVIDLMQRSGEIEPREALLKEYSDKLKAQGRITVEGSKSIWTLPTIYGETEVWYWQEVANITQMFADKYPVAEQPAAPIIRNRTGKRLMAKPLRDTSLLPMAMPFHETVIGLMSGRFGATEYGDSIYAQHGETQISLSCDSSVGFSPEVAIREIAKHGSAAVQTLLSISNLWLEKKKGSKYNSYLEGVAATDVLRFMGRKEVGKGGYRTEDQMELGRRIWLLSNLSVPVTQITKWKRGTAEEVTVSLGKLLIVDSIEHQITLDGSMKSTLRFNFHMGKYLHEWLCGDHPQYAEVSSKILHYNPENDKYLILFGFCLLHYDKVNRKHKRKQHTLTLAGLLKLAAVELPERNKARALDQWSRALDKLAADGVIPGLALRLPDDAARLSPAAVVAGSRVEFPAMLSRIPEEKLPLLPDAGLFFD